MKIIETDTNDAGQRTYLLEKGNASGTLIVGTVKGHGRYSFRYLLTGKMVTARDQVSAYRLVLDRETQEGK